LFDRLTAIEQFNKTFISPEMYTTILLVHA